MLVTLEVHVNLDDLGVAESVSVDLDNNLLKKAVFGRENVRLSLKPKVIGFLKGLKVVDWIISPCLCVCLTFQIFYGSELK